MADYIHPELRNLAGEMDEDALTTIGEEVYEAYQWDDQSRQGWMTQHGEWLRIYHQRDKPVNRPWEGSSEESIPLLAEGCTQFSARAFRAMFPSRNIVKGLATGEIDAYSADRAKRIAAHMSWQLMVKDKTYKRNKDRLLLSLPLHGSFFTKTFYDPYRGNVVENVRAADLIVPYGKGPRNLEDIDRKTQVVHMPMNHARALVKIGYFIEEPEPMEMEEQDDITSAEDDSQGIQPSHQDPNRPAMLIEQHCLLDLDDDGIAEPYIVTVDATSHKCLRISVRYETDEQGGPVDYKRPVEAFTHYTYMENPDGFYGLGLGHLISQPNISVNKLLRQFIDSATLSNVGNHSGFISEQLGGLQGEELSMQLGKFKKIPGTVDDIQKGLFVFQFPGPQQAHLTGIELLTTRSDRLATMTEAITGQTENVQQPTTVLALIEQSMQIFSTVYERVADSWSEELKKLYDLNYKHLDEEEYFSVLDVAGAQKSYSVGREDYGPGLEVIPIIDPKNTTQQQKLTKAQIEYQTMLQNPLTMQSPQHIYNVTRRFLEAIEAESIEEILPNPAEMGGVRVDDPNMENFAVVQPFPIMPMVFPDQDHQAHLEVHNITFNDPESGMTALSRQMLKAHIDGHARVLNGQDGGQGVASAQGNAGGTATPGSEILDGSVQNGPPGSTTAVPRTAGGGGSPEESTPSLG